jgi:hypothetical protein
MKRVRIFGTDNFLLWVPFFDEVLCLFCGYTFRFGRSFESTIRTHLGAGRSICATVHNPKWGLLPPVEGRIIKVMKREDWRSVVHLAISATDRVVVLAGNSHGLREELTIIRRERQTAEQEVYIAIPPNLEAESIDSYASVLMALGYNLAPGLLKSGGLYSFSRDWIAFEIATGIESAEEVAYEICAWCMYREKAAAQWCEFEQRVTQPTALGRCSSCGLILDLSRLSSIWPSMGCGVEHRMTIFPDDSIDQMNATEASSKI